jgi:hypothetical protein
MNENIQNWIIEQGNNITNWAGAEIPSFIQEFLTWNFYSGIINIASCSIILGVIALLYLKFRKQIQEMVEDCNPVCIFIGAGMLIAVVILPINIYENIKDVVQIKVAPKVYLVEKAAEMLKNK